ncbi:MAG: 2-C-methyl-D-erythritol 4-phosphate cytidylyltransferase [Balneolaceae bacterium]
MAKLSVIFPAAGSGVRLGSSTPKPFIKIGDKTILEHTISKFTAVPGLIQVIVATSVDSIPIVEEIFKSFLSIPVQFLAVEGADERQFSIQNALENIRDEADLVAVHDAVRPFVNSLQIKTCCEAAGKYGGAVLGVPAKDTIKKVKADRLIESTPDRSCLWQAQTPQIFKKELLQKAYKAAMKTNFIGTDDAALVERIGGVIQMVEGERENLKITYPIDLKVAELILGEDI